MENIRITKVLGNNVVIADHYDHNEVILVGKGIGFNKTPGSTINAKAVEKTFVLHDDTEKMRYTQLLSQVDDQIIVCMDEVFSYLKDEFGVLPQELLVNLTDHVAFCINRIQSGMTIKNSLLNETKMLFPYDYSVSQKVCEIIYKYLQINLPDDEVGFIALYIHTVSNKRATKDVKVNAELMLQVITLIEDRLEKPLNKEGLFYSRFIHHLRFAIDRITSPEYQVSEVDILEIVQDSYPQAYALALEIGEMLSKRLKVTIHKSEIIYLSIHIERITK